MNRILIVEDDQVNARYVAHGLEELGHTATICSDGTQALELALGQHWDVMILDRMLPKGIDGLSILLEADGIEVEGIGSGPETAEAIGRFHPDVVLLDYGLPGMDGSEVYALIRTLDSTVPIIFATGHGDRRTVHDSLNDPRTMARKLSAALV